MYSLTMARSHPYRGFFWQSVFLSACVVALAHHHSQFRARWDSNHGASPWNPTPHCLLIAVPVCLTNYVGRANVVIPVLQYATLAPCASLAAADVVNVVLWCVWAEQTAVTTAVFAGGGAGTGPCCCCGRRKVQGGLCSAAEAGWLASMMASQKPGVSRTG
jgi:hypothetical protein